MGRFGKRRPILALPTRFHKAGMMPMVLRNRREDVTHLMWTKPWN